MKKLLLLAAGLVAISGVAVASPDYQFNQEGESTLVKLETQGYTDIKITGTKKGYCTIAEDNFDFNAALFTAKKGNQAIKGVVCDDQIYITQPSKKA